MAEGLSAVDRPITTDDRVIPCLPNSMKLADWARTQGVDDKTAYRWFRAGLLPVPATPISTGTSMKGAGSSTRIQSRFPRNHNEAPLETLSEIAIRAARVDVTRGCHAALNLKDVAASDTETKNACGGDRRPRMGRQTPRKQEPNAGVGDVLPGFRATVNQAEGAEEPAGPASRAGPGCPGPGSLGRSRWPSRPRPDGRLRGP